MNPILEREFLTDLTFTFYIALNTAEDFHPMSLYQLNYLCENKEFKCIFRIRDNKEEFQKKYRNFRMTNERFDSIVLPDV